MSPDAAAGDHNRSELARQGTVFESTSSGQSSMTQKSGTMFIISRKAYLATRPAVK